MEFVVVPCSAFGVLRALEERKSALACLLVPRTAICA